MIRHALTFARQAALLDEQLRRGILAECWSQEKNRLDLRFVDGRESMFVEISLDLRIGYALPEENTARARRNTIDFFGPLLGARLQTVTADEGERIIRMHFADGRTLALFFFGRGSGNVLLLRDGHVIEAFQNDEGEYEGLLVEAEEPLLPRRPEILDRVRSSDLPPDKTLARAVPSLGRRLAAEALHRAGLTDQTSLAALPEPSLLHLLETVDELYAECEQSETFFLYVTPDEVVFSLTELRTVASKAERTVTFHRIDEALRTYRRTRYRTGRSTDLRKGMLRVLKTEKGRLERLLQKSEAPEDLAERAAEWETAGNLILAGLHLIDKGATSVRLPDWEGSEREVTLAAKYSPVENAERYFKRARGARESIERSDKRRKTAAGKLSKIHALQRKVQGAESLDQLEALKKEEDIFQGMEKKPTAPNDPERFRRFEVEGGCEVFAGKNAANNDELTVRFARPNDYWFHARGASGSHVVLRWGDPKSKPPREAIRAAAAIAAYYSDARKAKMAPVAYTLKKYVRKPKGAAKGAVVMERESVVMVEPGLPDSGG